MNQTTKTFTGIINNLSQFWQSQGITPVMPYHKEVGAGTLAPFTALNLIDDKSKKICYPQYCLRPTDARFAKNPNRLGSYYQYQVLIKPVDEYKNIQNMVINSFEAIGINIEDHDIRFIEDNWQNESIGASGLGYEIWCDGMEIAQFTYIQTIGGMPCKKTSCEITYGLERIVMYIQNVDNIFNIIWDKNDQGKVLYQDIHSKDIEIQYSEYFKNFSSDNQDLVDNLKQFINTCKQLTNEKLQYPAYEFCLKASHALNIIDARGIFTPDERMSYIMTIKNLMSEIVQID